MLAIDGRDVMSPTAAERRALLENGRNQVEAPIYLTPMTRDRAVARNGSRSSKGAGLDGVIAKPERDPYRAWQARDDQGEARSHR